MSSIQAKLQVKICIPVKERDPRRAILQVKKVSKYGDFVEIWLDGFLKDAKTRRQLIQTCSKPVIAVCRRPAENGSFSGSEEERIGVLEQAVLDGARFVDIEFETRPSFIKKMKAVCLQRGAKLIISNHNRKKTPDLPELLAVMERARNLGADIVKIATQVNQWSDNVVLFEAVRRFSSAGRQCIVVGMGEKGKISRIGAPLLGSFLTYAPLEKKSATAEGQLTVEEMRRFSRI